VISVVDNPRNFNLEYLPLLINLPSYSRIVIVSPSDLEDEKALLRRHNLLGRCKFIKGTTSKYAQDIGESISNSKSPGIVVPWGSVNRIHSSEEAVEAARQFLKELNIVRAPFNFEGGNITSDMDGNVRYVFIGYDAILKTIKLHAEKGEIIYPSGVIAKISEFFDAQVICFGYPKQNKRMFHIDFSFHLLRGKIAVVADYTSGFDLSNGIKDPATQENRALYLNAQAQQRSTINILESLKYKIIKLSHSYEDFICNRFRVNGITFKDRIDGIDKVLLPVFDNDLVRPLIERSRFNILESHLKPGLIDVVRIYRSNSIQPILVYADPWRYHTAGIHCAMLHW